MPRGKDPTQPYAHRRLDATVINTTMDSEAVELLYRYGGSGRQNTECVPPFTHDVCVRAVWLALPPVLREARPVL